MKQRKWIIALSGFLIVISVLISTGTGSATQRKEYLKHIETKADITSAYTIYEVCNPTGIPLVLSSDNDFNITFKEVRNYLSSWDVKIEEVEHFTEDVPIYEHITTTFNETIKDNSTGQVITVKKTKKEKAIKRIDKVEKTRKVWKKFQPKGKTFNANTCYLIRVEGAYPAKIGGTEIDNVLSFAGHTFDEYAWWANGTNWSHRQQINITNNNASQVLEAGYSINISIDHFRLVDGGKSNRDGRDIRIVYTNSSGDYSIDWINTTPFDTWNQNTVIWFNLQENITAGGYNYNYSIYYGNPLAGSPPNNKTKVFFVYDDFTNNSIDDSVWTTGVYYGGTISESSGELVQSGDSDWHGAGAQTKYVFNKGQTFEIIYKHRVPSTYPNGDSSSVYLEDPNVGRGATYGAPITASRLWYAGHTTFFQRTYKINVYGPSGTYSRYLWNGTVWNAEVSSAAIPSWGSIPNDYVVEFWRGHYGVHPGYWDDIMIIKRFPPEPTVSLIDEERQSDVFLSTPIVKPSSGPSESIFNFTVRTTTTNGTSANVTLQVFDQSQNQIFKGTTKLENTTALEEGFMETNFSLQLNDTGTYTYYWQANLTTNPGIGTSTAVINEPTVYQTVQTEDFTVPQAATRVMVGAYWMGLSNESRVEISLTDLNTSTNYSEHQVPTLAFNFKTAVIDLPLITYNITVYSGYKEMVYNSSSVGSDWRFTLTKTDVSRVETEIGWS